MQDLESLLEKSVVNIFNTFQKSVANEVIPKIIETFSENGVEIDESSLLQFFQDIANYEEISKYFVNSENTARIGVNGIVSDKRTNKPKIKNNSNVVRTCDYVNTRGENKGTKCQNNAEYQKEGHPRCNKHKNHVVKEKMTTQKTEPKKNNGKIISDEDTDNDEPANNKIDIKTLLAKIKASK